MVRATARGAGRPPIALLSDFGYRDHYVGAMKAVIASIAPGAPLIDITHGVPPQSVVTGALALRESWRYFPPGTVFLAVVDPGVGTARLPIAVESESGYRFVGPDNGLLWPSVEQAGFRRAVELKSRAFRLAKVSSTFHGRDIFAPAAAHLWRGTPLHRLGPAVKRIAKLEIEKPRLSGGSLVGKVLYIDGFGNLVSNIDRESLSRLASGFPGSKVWVRIGGGAKLDLCETYATVRKGAGLATFGSFELLEIAVRDGNAARRLRAKPGTTVRLETNRHH